MPPTSPPTSEEVEGAYWFGSVRAVSECSESVCQFVMRVEHFGKYKDSG